MSCTLLRVYTYPSCPATEPIPGRPVTAVSSVFPYVKYHERMSASTTIRLGKECSWHIKIQAHGETQLGTSVAALAFRYERGHQLSVVWYDFLLCYAMVFYGMVCCGMVCCGAIRYGTVRNGKDVNPASVESRLVLAVFCRAAGEIEAQYISSSKI